MYEASLSAAHGRRGLGGQLVCLNLILKSVRPLKSFEQGRWHGHACRGEDRLVRARLLEETH